MNISKILAECAANRIELNVTVNELEVAFDQYPSDELLAQLKQHKAAIIEFLVTQQESAKSSASVNVITVVERNNKLPLSFSQQRLWLLDKVDGGSSHYNIPSTLRLSGALNIKALDKAFATIVARHESLRTCFSEDNEGQPLQFIQQEYGFGVKFSDLSALTYEEQRRQLSLTITQEAELVFDLRSDLMLRVQVLKLSESEHEVLVTMHHIASDGWSTGILINEFSILYTAFTRGQENPLTPLSIQYADYAHWQRNWLQGDRLDQQLSYWTEQLAGLPVVHSLPLDKSRPAVQTFEGQIYQSQISLGTTQTLNQLCQNFGATLYMGLQTVFSVLLSRYSNETDIVIGSPIANREQAEIAPLIGFFINTLVLRSDLSGNPGFTELLERNKQMLLDSYSHQQVSFEQVVEKLAPARSLSHSPLFQVVLAMHNNEKRPLELPELTLTSVEQGNTVAKYDLLLNVSENDQGLTLTWEYNTGLFNEDTIARMAVHFERLLEAMLDAPQQSVFKAPMLTVSEITLQQLQWNDTTIDYRKDKCIHQLFEQQVLETPDQTAVIYNDEVLSYRQLNCKANRLAHLLIETGIEPGSRVGIHLERSAQMLISVLAIMKSGGTYVPLEPGYPVKRIELILDDAELEVVLLNSTLMGSFPVRGVDVLLMDDAATDDEWMAEYSADNLENDESGVTSDSLAYILYTSGSTGRPKGVMVPHSGVVNYLNHARNYLNETVAGAIVSSPLAFDATLTTLLTPLMAGKVVKLLPEGDEGLSMLAEQMFEQQQAWLFKITPAHLEALSQLVAKDKVCTSAHQIVVGGEQLTYQSLALFRESVLPNATFFNEYGPTETVVGCSVYSLLPKNQQITEQSTTTGLTVPIGKPICNTRLYVMSPHMNIQPINSIGELYIGGDGVTLGYLNRDELNHQHFIEHPTISGERLYRTGDLVHWLPDGQMEFVGRVDHQVKIRGFRIELGEIENVLRDYDDIRDAIVLARTDDGDKRLVAYVVPSKFPADGDMAQSQKSTLATDYINRIKQQLPQYMVPSLCLLLPSMPLTANGKIDRDNLPLPDGSEIQRQEYVAPSNDTESLLCEIWQELLQVDRVGITDNFFELGGHSLSATRLFAQINQKIGLNLSLQIIFTKQTVAEMAVHIDFLQAQKEINNQKVSESEIAVQEEVEW